MATDARAAFRKVFAVLGGALGAALLMTAVAWGFGYVSLWQPAVLTPRWPAAAWRTPLLTMAEHDAVLAARPKPRFPYVLHFESERGALLHFGAFHSRDPSRPQFARLRTSFHEFRPTVVLVETRSRYLNFGGYERWVRQGGEAAAAAFLGQRAGAAIHSLEPDRAEVAAALLRHFSPAQVAMNMTLGTYWGDKEGGRAVSDAHADKLLRQRTALPGLGGALADVAALDAQWRREFPGLPNWRERSLDSRSSAAAGTSFAAMAVMTNDVRDEHWMRVIMDLVTAGERVFVVCGGSHTIRQEPVLRAELTARGFSERARP